MKILKLTIVLFIVFGLNVFAQNEKPKLHDILKVNDSTRIIGIYPHFDKNQTFKDLNFIIENPTEIKKVIQNFELGDELPNSLDNPNFRVLVVQNFKDVNSWIVSPYSKKVLTKGHTYTFDIEKIKKLHEKYPLNYKFEKVSFKNNNEFSSYLLKQKQNPKFLFSYNPIFKYEGSFELQFPKNEKFSSPKSISQYIRPMIEKIANPDDFSISYKASEYNLKNADQFTMTITGSKQIFDNLKVDELIKKTWSPTEESGIFFYKE